jgi:urea transport system substrate-binding protein
MTPAARSEATGPKILIVEDDEDLLDLMKLVLAGEGYQVETARNGHDAMELVRKDLPDLILLDMKMPVMNGWEFAARFYHQHERVAKVLVVTHAASAQSRAGDVNATGFLGKPFSKDQLIAAVRASLNG